MQAFRSQHGHAEPRPAPTAGNQVTPVTQPGDLATRNPKGLPHEGRPHGPSGVPGHPVSRYARNHDGRRTIRVMARVERLVYVLVMTARPRLVLAVWLTLTALPFAGRAVPGSGEDGERRAVAATEHQFRSSALVDTDRIRSAADDATASPFAPPAIVNVGVALPCIVAPVAGPASDAPTRVAELPCSRAPPARA